MLQRYKKNRTSASFLLTKCATFLIKCYWGTFSVPSFADDPYFYELRAYVNYYLKNFKAARKDCQKAYKLSTDPEADKRIQALYDVL